MEGFRRHPKEAVSGNICFGARGVVRIGHMCVVCMVPVFDSKVPSDFRLLVLSLSPIIYNGLYVSSHKGRESQH